MKKNNALHGCLLLAACIPGLAFAQQYTVSGRVTAEEGDALEGFEVCLITLERDWVACGVTDSDGEYETDPVAPGAYYVNTWSPEEHDYINEFHADLQMLGFIDFFEFATAIEVEQDVQNLDFALARGVHLTGVVVDQHGIAVPDVSVCTNEPGVDGFHIGVTCGNTDENGFYRTDNMPTGEYFVGFFKEGYAFAWHDETQPLNLAANASLDMSLFEIPGYDLAVAELSFPDANLQACVTDAIDMRGAVVAGEIDFLDCSGRGISSIAGLEQLGGLTFVQFQNNDITEAVFTGNPLLHYIGLHNNAVSTFDPGMPRPRMRALDLSDNALASVDLSKVPGLQELWLSNNALTSIDVSPVPNLRVLWAENNALEELILGAKPDLQILRVNNNALSALDIDALPILELLDIRSNPLSTQAHAYLSGIERESLVIELDAPPMDLAIFPDPVFRACVVDAMATSNVASAADLTLIDCRGRGVESVEGIESLPNLQTLHLAYNDITAIDMSGNGELETLNILDNPLAALDVAVLPKLRVLLAGGRSETTEDGTGPIEVTIVGPTLSELDVSTNTQLQFLEVRNTHITHLDVSTNPLLKGLVVPNNPLTSLDLSQNTMLETLVVTYSPLDSIDLTVNTALRAVDLYHTALSHIDVSAQTALERLWIWNTPLVPETIAYLDAINGVNGLDVRHGLGLRSTTIPDPELRACLMAYLMAGTWLVASDVDDVDCNNRGIVSLEGLDQFPNLARLDLHGNGIVEADLSGNRELRFLDLSGNPLTQLDLSSNEELLELYVVDTPLAELDLSNNEALEVLEVGGIVELTWITPDLATATVTDDVLRTLILGDKPALYKLDISNTRLSPMIDFATLPVLQSLSATRSGLSSVDVGDNPELRELVLTENALTTIDVSGNLLLELLGLNANALSAIDVSGNPVLERLLLRENSLREIDVSANPALWQLSLSDNQIRSLNVDANTALRVLDVTGNPLSTATRRYLDRINGRNGLTVLRDPDPAPPVSQPKEEDPVSPPPPPPPPATGVDEIQDELGDIVVPEGEEDVDEETVNAINDVLDSISAHGDEAAERLAQGTLDKSTAIDMLGTFTEALGLAGSANEKGGAIDKAGVSASLASMSKMLDAFGDGEGLNEVQRAQLETVTQDMLGSVARLISADSDIEAVKTLVDGVKDVLSAALRAGTQLKQSIAQEGINLSQKALEASFDKLAAESGVDTSALQDGDVDSMKTLLKENKGLLDKVLDTVGVELPSSVELDKQSLLNNLQSNGIAEIAAQQLSEDLGRFVNPAGVNLEDSDGNGVTALDTMTRSVGSPSAQIEMDEDTGVLLVETDTMNLPVNVKKVTLVPPSIPDGLTILPDGSVLSVSDGVAVNVVPGPADPVALVSGLGGAVDVTFKNDGGILLKEGSALFSGTFTFNNLTTAPEGEPLEHATIRSPEGLDPADPDYVYTVDYPDGTRQKIAPFVSNDAFFASLSARGLEFSTARGTGIVTVAGGRFRPSYFVSPAEEGDLDFLAANADSMGIAYRQTDVNGDGIRDFEIISTDGVQVIYGLR